MNYKKRKTKIANLKKQALFGIKTRLQRWGVWLLLGLFVTIACLSFSSVKVIATNTLFSLYDQNIDLADGSKKSKSLSQVDKLSKDINLAKQAYQEENYIEVVEILEKVLIDLKESSLTRAAVLNNLALAYQQLSKWDKIASLIEESETILAQTVIDDDSKKVLASILDIKGRFQLVSGEKKQALSTWQQATNIYQQLGDERKITNSLINQAQALQSLGFYRRSTQMLTKIKEILQEQPDSLTKVVGLRSLGNSLQSVGDLEQAQKALTSSLTVAQQIGASEDIRAALFSLGNIAFSRREYNKAIDYYQQVIEDRSTSSEQRTRAQLNQLSVLIEAEQRDRIPPLLLQIEAQLDSAKISRASLYAKINYAQNLTQFSFLTKSSQIEEILSLAVIEARQLVDRSAESYALGNLGRLYEQENKWNEAQRLTQEALEIAQNENDQYIAYQWQWQLGRIFKARADQAKTAEIKEGFISKARDSYEKAYRIVRSLREDLLYTQRELQFNFRDRFEPIYREYVSLQLPFDDADQDSINENAQFVPLAKTEKLNKDSKDANIRKIIADLQLAELENFLECNLDLKLASNGGKFVDVDDVIDAEHKVSAIYPIILKDRIEVLLKLPDEEQLYRRSPPIKISPENVKSKLELLREELEQPYFSSKKGKSAAQEVYSWLIEPAEKQGLLDREQTLVFILDGPFRNVPMAALYDGEKYLIEKYAISVALGNLKLPDSQPKNKFKALIAGVSERPKLQPLQGEQFGSLEFVDKEIEDIKSVLTEAKILSNEEFNRQNLVEEIKRVSYNVVHLATHGQFGLGRDQTFILTAAAKSDDSFEDIKTDLNELDDLFQFIRQEPIELLILSACETGEGDDREVLGIAGLAAQSGIRSTLASLWSIDDSSTAELMKQFYKGLTSGLTKAEALQQAQLYLLDKYPGAYKPSHWAPYILVGDWR